MKFIGLFGASFFLILIGLSIFSFLFENIYGIIALCAFLMALVLRAYLELNERLEQLEHHLKLAEKKVEKSFSEQLRNEANPLNTSSDDLRT